MATSCKLRAQNCSMRIDNQIRRSYTHEFHIRTDDPYMLQPDVYLAARSASPIALPAMWTPYSSFSTATGGSGTGYSDDNYVFLQDLELKRLTDEIGVDWLATCTWRYPEPGNSGQYKPQFNPLDDPVRYSLEWAQFTRIAEFDINGNAIVNSAGDKFDPPVEIDDARPVLVAVKNMYPLTDIIALAQQFRNAVNDAEFYGAGPREAKIENIVSGQLMERNGFPYYTVVFRIQFNLPNTTGTNSGHSEDVGWDIALVDRGSQVLEPVPGGGTAMRKAWPKKLDENGNPVTPLEYVDFVNLEPDGTRRDDELPALFTQPWQVYPEQDFSLLGIGTTPYG